MMQEGLHIGLAAWINHYQNDNFYVCPSSPFPVKLVHLDSIEEVQDVKKAVEFSELVNFIPKQGEVADIYNESQVLWREHRTLLEQMNFASVPLTSVEQAEYETARNFLYTNDERDGFPRPTTQYIIYQEMERSYNDSVNGGGTSIDIDKALSDWLVIGQKHKIEGALATLSRFANRSSSISAARDKIALMEDPQGPAIQFFEDRYFAPVYFAPISAIARETWLEAKVTFNELERVVTDNSLKTKWKAYRANRDGEITFEYVAIKCMRPWFDPLIYQADDWKFDSATKASQGNGKDGKLPAIVSTVYVVGIKDVTTKPRTSPVTIIPPIRTTTLFTPLGKFRKPNANFISTKGVVKGRVNKPLMENRKRNDTLSTSVGPQVVRPVLTLDITSSTVLQASLIRKIDAAHLNRRLLIAQALLELNTDSNQESVEETNESRAFVVGFGCDKIPFSPNPNPTYVW